MTSKKFKPLNRISQLNGGNLYIRALFNFVGDCWYEVHRINGRAYRDRRQFASHTLRIKTTTWRWDDNGYYLSDLGLLVKSNSAKRLFPFSHKLLLKLEALKADRKAFYCFLTGKTMTDHEWSLQEIAWHIERGLDADFERVLHSRRT
jgi:hypothetical protein